MAGEFEDDWQDKDEFTPEELKVFRQLLMDERVNVVERLKMRLNEAVGESTAMPDEGDQAQQLTEQASMLRLADKEQKLLKLIDRALKKFETGDYGFCEGTGDLINPARLRLRPWTRYSIEYKEEQERAEKGFVKHRSGGNLPRGAATPSTGGEAEEGDLDLSKLGIGESGILGGD